MLGPGEDAARRSSLDDAPLVEDDDLVAQGGGREIVRHEQ